LQKGGFQFLVIHGGGWVWFDHRHALAWHTNRHLYFNDSGDTSAFILLAGVGILRDD